jgi:hypothetical protein
MTILSDSYTRVQSSPPARGNVYFDILFIIMSLSATVSLIVLGDVQKWNFKDPIFTENSVSYSATNLPAYIGQGLLAIFFAITAFVLLMIILRAVNSFVMSLCIMSLIGFIFVIGSLTTLDRVSIPTSDELRLVEANLGKDYDTILSDVGNIYVSYSDGEKYMFKKSYGDAEMSVIGTLEKVGDK